MQRCVLLKIGGNEQDDKLIERVNALLAKNNSARVVSCSWNAAGHLLSCLVQYNTEAP